MRTVFTVAVCAAAVAAAAVVGGGAARAEGPLWEVFGVEVDKKDPFLNIRQAGSGTAAIVAKLPPGTQVAVLETRGDWRHVRVASGADSGKEGWGYFCCLKPVGSVDLYRAVLSAKDHFNRSGDVLQNPAGIVQQDRANFHRFDDKDKGDTHDRVFHEEAKRHWLASVLAQTLSAEDKRVILQRTPKVEVIVYADSATLTVLDQGQKLE